MIESQVVSLVIKVMRKLIQILINDSSSIIDESKILLQPKQFSKDIRVINK